MPSSHHRDAYEEKIGRNSRPQCLEKYLLLLPDQRKRSDPHAYLLQSVVELHRPEQEVLLAPHRGADLLARSPQLAALGPDGVLCVVGVVYQPVPLTRQRQGAVQCVLLGHIDDVSSLIYRKYRGFP